MIFYVILGIVKNDSSTTRFLIATAFTISVGIVMIGLKIINDDLFRIELEKLNRDEGKD